MNKHENINESIVLEPEFKKWIDVYDKYLKEQGNVPFQSGTGTQPTVPTQPATNVAGAGADVTTQKMQSMPDPMMKIKELKKDNPDLAAQIGEILMQYQKRGANLNTVSDAFNQK